MRGLNVLEPDPERRLKYLDFIDIYAALDENERIVYRQRYPEEVAEMTRFAERFIQQGLEQGLEQGRQEGREEGIGQGEARMLLRLLTLKFGPCRNRCVRGWNLPMPRRCYAGPNGC
jgi:flagellar biosynthesis/type III secretory pathway protein FliH